MYLFTGTKLGESLCAPPLPITGFGSAGAIKVRFSKLPNFNLSLGFYTFTDNIAQDIIYELNILLVFMAYASRFFIPVFFLMFQKVFIVTNERRREGGCVHIAKNGKSNNRAGILNNAGI